MKTKLLKTPSLERAAFPLLLKSDPDKSLL